MVGRILCTMLTLAFALASSHAAEKAPQPAPALKKDLVTANNQFAWELYQQLSAEEGNLFYSPASISIAMSMAMAGAEGETERQMAKVLRLDGDEADVYQQFSTLLAHWNAEAKRPYQLSVANRLWAQQGYDILASYRTITADQYHAPIALVDFAQSEAARSEINAWVEKQTNDKIQNLLPQGSLTADTRLVLTNAIYFKGDWQHEFEEDNTKPLPFFLAKDKQVDVPLMYQQEKFPYFENDKLQAISLPYKGGELSMVVVLPREKEGLAELESELSQQNIDAWSPRRQREAMVWLPKFKSESEFNLNATLKALGMTLPFSTEADFSGISGRDDLHISDVVHKAFVEVNEKGTEAAAATGVIVGITSAAIDPPRPAVFRADRPFVYFIKDNVSGSVLFVGRM
ncbi:MAG: serpin family protein, partial [Pirellulales bacterium]